MRLTQPLRDAGKPVVSALLKERVRRPSMLKKLAHAEDLLEHFPNGAYVGWSGFTGMLCAVVKSQKSAHIG